ncbi:MAG: SxtJ family membrane protein [Prolixibacteraceae bacterium]
MQIKSNFTKKEHTDSGLALLLLTLVAGLWFKKELALQFAIPEVLILLVAPVLIYPFTFLWLNVSEIMGKLMSRIILSVVFFVMVWPVALIRRAMGKDTLRLKSFGESSGSVFTERKHTWSKADLTTPY